MRYRRRDPDARGRGARLACILSLLQACSAADMPVGSSSSMQAPASKPARYANWPDRLALFAHGPEQVAQFCARPGSDRVRDAFCSGQSPPTSLVDLQTRLGVDSAEVSDTHGLSGGHVAAISVTGHSTSLAKRSVSAINPRVIALRVALSQPADFNGSGRADLLALGFARGEQLVEVVTSDRATAGLNFYVVGFRQACNSSDTGCTAGDLLTPSIETGWTEVTPYDETDLTDTVFDCATCHQPDGPGTPKLLRMQEFDSPWTHWFSPTLEGGRALLADYLAAKGGEGLAGMTSDQLQHADPASLATLIDLVSPTQPNKFPSANVEREVKASAAALGGDQPFDNSIAGQSAAWDNVYQQALLGDAIAVPYHDVKVTDEAKLAHMSEAYQAYLAGALSADQLPDIRDVFPDDQARLAELGLATAPGLDGAGVLRAACSQCHNEHLDQTLSRARFRADLQGLSRAEKDIAIERLGLPASDPLAMPPARLRVLSDEARARAIEVLQQ